MPQAEVRVDARSTGADLRAIARELRNMDDRKLKDLFQRKLEDAARPFVPRVQASVLAIPVKDPERVPVLRPKIARCVQVASWEPAPRQVSTAVEVYPEHMPMGERGLPLYMQGVADKGRHNRWRHPVYGNRDVWVQQDSHPYFYQAVSGYGLAAGEAMRRALDDITRQLSR